MASFDQDLIVFEDDTLLVQYTFTDLETTFNSGWSVWWGACLTTQLADPAVPAGESPDSTNIVQKANNWTAGDPATTPSDTGDIVLVNGTFIARVYIKQSDFTFSAPATILNSLQTDKEYTTQLVISQDTTENQSVTSAQGTLFISSSLFTAAGYRPS
tara:strand:+ start:55 stop:528 length:474 start_codon:yes stop_codon:yes gene_type:complete